MPTTSGLALPYPALTAAPNVPADIQALADRLEAIHNTAWAAYTPALTNATLGNGTVIGRYKQIGKTVTFLARFTLGSTSAVAASAALSVPVAAVTITGRDPGPLSIKLFDVSANTYQAGLPLWVSTTVITIIPHGFSSNISGTVPWTWATGDTIDIGGTYEVA